MKKNKTLYPKIYKSNLERKKYKEVTFSVSDRYEKLIGRREDVMYDKMSIYVLILAIRDVLYDGNNTYLCQSRLRAIKWFKESNYEIPFGYKTICTYFDFDPNKLWLQIRRWFKVNPEFILSSLKSAESATFDNPRSILEDKINV